MTITYEVEGKTDKKFLLLSLTKNIKLFQPGSQAGVFFKESSGKTPSFAG
jgi:hypothetical protein